MKITGTLLALLTVSILLGNIVVIAFWHKGLVQSEVEHVRQICRTALNANTTIENQRGLKSQVDLKKLCSYAGRRCAGIALSGGEYWFEKNIPGLKDRAFIIAQESVASQKEIIRIDGDEWGLNPQQSRYLLIAEPLGAFIDQKSQSVVVVIVLDKIYETLVENYQAIFVYLLVNVILLTVIGFFRLVNITVKPIERMVKRSHSYHDSDSMFFSVDQNQSEFGQLSTALNSMLYRIESDREKLRQMVTSLESANAELLKTQKEMIRTEKIASVGRLSAGLAHEIGNPIGIVQGYIELLQKADLSEVEKQQFAQRALSELDRINNLIRQLLDYAGSSINAMSRVNLNQLFTGLCQIVSMKTYYPPVILSQNIPPDIVLNCDGESLRQVFLNCLLNAIDALEAKDGEYEKKIDISAEVVADEYLATVYIKIEDNGIGIHPKDLDAIFDPFFTTKDPGKGTGLGLFVSHSIVDMHGGKIWIESNSGQGSVVHIKLPMVSEADQEEKHETSDH